MPRPAGTMLVVLEGGPPEWDGKHTAISKTGGGEMERWCHTADAAYVWRRTERTREVEVEHERRSGIVRLMEEATIYEAVGYREDHPRA